MLIYFSDIPLRMPQLIAHAILFDMDGTLVDSTVKVEQLWHKWCAMHDIGPARVMAIQHGARSSDTMRAVAPHLDIAGESAWMDASEAADCEGVVEVRGAGALVAQVPVERWTIATSAGRSTALARLAHCALPIPPTMVCADDVRAGKPDPEIYRMAAMRLGFDTADCLVFEDAPAGVASALAAGCAVVQVGLGRPFDESVKLVVPDLSGIQVRPRENALEIVFPG